MLTAGGSKTLRYMLEHAEGCDAWLSPKDLTVQYGWHLSHHHYYREVGVEVLAWLRERLGRTHGVLPVTAVPMIGEFPAWEFEPRAVWITEEQGRTTIRVRDAATTTSSEPPASIEPRPIFVLGERVCPHCGQTPDRYRVLRDGAQVCLGCGASSKAP